MANLLFPPVPGPVNYLVWLGVVLLMMLWLVYLRIEYGPTVVPITSEQEVGEKLQPRDVANSRRRQRGLGDLDEAYFADLQAKAFQQLQMSEPFLGRWVGRSVEKIRKHRDCRRKEN